MALSPHLLAAAIALSLLLDVPPSAADAQVPTASAVASTSAADVAPPSAATVVAPAAAPAADDWIRPEDITDRADSLGRLVETRLPTPATVASVDKIEAGLVAVDPELRSSLERVKRSLAGRTSLIAIQDARRELQTVAAPLPEWKKQLDAEARRVAEVLAEIERSTRRWTATRDRPETSQAGEAVVRRVNTSLALLQRSAGELKAWRIRLLAVADRLLDESAAVEDAISRMEAATVAEGTSLLIPDHPPLGQRGLLAEMAGELDQVPQRIAEYRSSTTAYLSQDARPLLLQALIAVVLMILFRRLPRYAAEHGRLSQASPETVRLLARPYAMALLLVLAASPMIHPAAPQRVTQLFGLAALFPVARILMVVNQRANLTLYAGLCVLLIVDRVASALTPLPALRLAAFLLELAIALALGVEYLRRLTAAGGNAWVIRLLRIGIFALAFAVVAEIGGWSSLAALLGRGTLGAAVSGLYVYAAVISVEALLACALASPGLRRSHFVDRNQALVHRWTAIAIRALGVLLWARVLLNTLGLRSLASEAVDATLAAGVSVGALTLTIGGVLAFVLTLLVSMLIGRVVHELLEDEIFPRTNLPRGIPHALTTLAGYAIYSLGFLIALAAAGVHLSQLAILLGGLGIGIGLGLQDVVKNFAAGLTLLLERRVHVGDTVQIHKQDVFGRVLSIGMRASVVRNWNGTEAVIPNHDLVSSPITNWTLTDVLQRIEVKVGVAYGSDPDAVIALLLAVARSDERLLTNPQPSALFTGFGKSSLDFVLRAWTDEQYEDTEMRTSQVALAVHRALRDAGILMPSAAQQAMEPTGD